jgi:CRP-like cAMP-binding protein
MKQRLAMPVTDQQDANAQEFIEMVRSERQLEDFRAAFEHASDLEEFAKKAEFPVYEQGVTVFQQGDPGRDFLFVMEGQLRALDIDQDPPRLLGYFNRGTIVGERALLGSPVRTATVEVISPRAKLAFFSEDDWYWLLSVNSRFRDYFENLESGRLQEAQFRFPGQQWDEVVVAHTKRHIVAFLTTLPVPITLLLAPVLFLGLAQLLGVPFLTTVSDMLFRITFLPFILISLALIIYNYFDWKNDDFIVTTKRVIHIERYLFFGEQRKDAPLTRIQDVTVTSGIVDVLFESDNVRITTAGAGVIDFNNIRQANHIRQVIFRERERAKARVAASDIAALRQNIAGQFGWSEKLETAMVEVAEPEVRPEEQPKTRHYNRLLDYFVPRTKEINDADGATIIVWRKHFLVLLGHILIPLLAILVSVYLFMASFVLWLPPFGAPVAWPIQLVLGVAIIASLFWYVWQYDDWNKDVYIVTNTQIIDIESSSFRLTRTRREGTFDNIQGVYSEVPTLFYKLINMGNVIIETAGTQETFTFDNVFDPASVTREIFNRWAAFQQREREKDRDATTSQVMTVLREYHALATKNKDNGVG